MKLLTENSNGCEARPEAVGVKPLMLCDREKFPEGQNCNAGRYDGDQPRGAPPDRGDDDGNQDRCSQNALAGSGTHSVLSISVRTSRSYSCSAMKKILSTLRCEFLTGGSGTIHHKRSR